MEKVMVTLPKELLDEVDVVSKDLGENRSQFVRRALIEAIRKIKRLRFEDLMREGYEEMSEEDLRDASAYLPSFEDLKGEGGG